MAFHNELVIAPYWVQMDAENTISLLVLAALITFFYFAFSRMVQPGGGKEQLPAEKGWASPMFYSSHAAA